MNKVLINYCYSWYRTNVLTRTDVSIAELTSDPSSEPTGERATIELSDNCLLYTSDAADE